MWRGAGRHWSRVAPPYAEWTVGIGQPDGLARAPEPAAIYSLYRNHHVHIFPGVGEAVGLPIEAEGPIVPNDAPGQRAREGRIEAAHRLPAGVIQQEIGERRARD